MTTITINKGKKSDIALLLDVAKRLDIEFSVEEKIEKMSLHSLPVPLNH